MRKWYAAFEDSISDEPTIISASPREAATLRRFDTVAKAGEIEGRKIYGMWIIDHDTEQGDVPRVHGAIPLEIQRRHQEWKARQKRRKEKPRQP